MTGFLRVILGTPMNLPNLFPSEVKALNIAFDTYEGTIKMLEEEGKYLSKENAELRDLLSNKVSNAELLQRIEQREKKTQSERGFFKRILGY